MGLPNDGEDAAMKARLNDLSTALDAHRKTAAARPSAERTAPPDGIGKAVSLGFRVMSEFVVAIVVAAFLGWTIDHWLGSSPAFLILFIGLGTAAGFWNVYRIAAKPPGPSGGSA